MLRRRASHVRVWLGLVVILSVVAAALPDAALALVPIDGPALTDFSARTINAGDGDQFDPHVNGDLVSYTSDFNIRYYNFFTGIDTKVPAEQNATDQLSGVSNGRIVLARSQDSGRQPIMVFDTSNATTTEIDPVPTPLRTNAAIGSDTVAFIDEGLDMPGDELLISALGGATVRITTDSRFDRQPAVAPLGNLVVYESCQTSLSNCDIHQAGWNGSSWIVTNLTNNSDPDANPEANPDTDGSVVVYDATRSGERDIYWQPVGGGTEQQLELPGEQRDPSVSGGVIAFESVAAGDTAADLYVYEIATNRLFRITSTPEDESLNDISSLGGGSFHIVWSSGASPNRDVYGATFTIPPLPGAYTFGGLVQPVDPLPTLNMMKAGAAVPVKFSLGGNQGLAIFATGYPKSQAIACNSTDLIDGIEETVTAGGSSLAYDALTDTYTYIRKTEKPWAGSCRQLVLGFADGTFERANFKFK